MGAGVLTDMYAQFEVAIFCPRCEEFHRLRVWTVDGRFPIAVAVGEGPGSGWLYSPTGEDLGVDDGVSVPVYRATAAFEPPALPALYLGAFTRPEA